MHTFETDADAPRSDNTYSGKARAHVALLARSLTIAVR
jgi:hypothetical protein